MEQKMFCYQCEQTVGCTACTGAAGVCGKKAGHSEATGRTDRCSDRHWREPWTAMKILLQKRQMR